MLLRFGFGLPGFFILGQDYRYYLIRAWSRTTCRRRANWFTLVVFVDLVSVYVGAEKGARNEEGKHMIEQTRYIV